MSSERPVRTPIEIDSALLAAHPELAVLTLNLPDSDGEPMENEPEQFQMLLLRDSLQQYWRGRQDFYMGGNMFVYYSTAQARQILAEEAEPARPRRAFRGPDLFVVLNVDGSFRRQKWVVWDEEGHYPDVIFEFLSPSSRRTDQTTKKTLYEQTLFRDCAAHAVRPMPEEVVERALHIIDHLDEVPDVLELIQLFV